jgi:hypothetical protein
MAGRAARLVPLSGRSVLGGSVCRCCDPPPARARESEDRGYSRSAARAPRLRGDPSGSSPPGRPRLPDDERPGLRRRASCSNAGLAAPVAAIRSTSCTAPIASRPSRGTGAVDFDWLLGFLGLVNLYVGDCTARRPRTWLWPRIRKPPALSPPGSRRPSSACRCEIGAARSPASTPRCPHPPGSAAGAGPVRPQDPAAGEAGSGVAWPLFRRKCLVDAQPISTKRTRAARLEPRENAYF